MPKVSPHIRSFNAGEFSELLGGRVDLERYSSSMRVSRNCIITPQGPVICRSGTQFVTPAGSDSETSTLVPFIFSNEQAQVVEFTQDRVRFIDETGIQIYAYVPVTATATDPMTITGAVGATVGDEVALSGFPADYNLNGEIASVTAVFGTTFTLDIPWPLGKPVVAGQAALVYSITSDMEENERDTLRHLQSVDVTYLFTGVKRPRKLSRRDTYDWVLEDVKFVDGPYMPVNETTTKLIPSATGNALPYLTSNAGPGGTANSSGNRPAVVGTVAAPVDFLGRDITYTMTASDAYHAFLEMDDISYWAGNTAQKGDLYITTDTAFVADGYTIYAAIDNVDTAYLAKDYAPADFVLEATLDGTNWVELDRQENYVLYDASKSVFFPIRNSVAYNAYRLRVLKLVRNGLIEPRIRRITMRSTASAVINLTATSTVGINKGNVGFLSSDVGRLIRIEGADKSWRPCEIVAVFSPTVVAVRLDGEPLVDTSPIRNWRLGYWSDTTGWPTCGEFFGDRLYVGGSVDFPDLLVGSVVGDYENMAPSDGVGVVLAESGIAVRLNSRRLSRIRWIASDEKGLLVGTGSEEWVIAPGTDNKNITPLPGGLDAKPSTRRGSANVEPVKIDRQVLYVQRNRRTLREFAYTFEADGYRSPSMSQLASHLGVPGFEDMDYSAEPHSIVWLRRGDKSLVGLTYNREESIVGWHQQDFADAEIESLCVIPQNDQLQDTLWVQTRRMVNGQPKRYIEYLTRPWDFGMSLSEAHYVDCALRYQGGPTKLVFGLQHLEGLEVYGLADNRPVGPFTVENGTIELDYEASNIVIGLGFESFGETSRIENGAADGTAQGKTKRINGIVPYVWDTACGEIGVWNPEKLDEAGNKGAYELETIEFPGDLTLIEENVLYTGMTPPLVPAAVNDVRGAVAFRRPKETPLPFNIIALMPQLDTQDR